MLPLEIDLERFGTHLKQMRSFLWSIDIINKRNKSKFRHLFLFTCLHILPIMILYGMGNIEKWLHFFQIRVFYNVKIYWCNLVLGRSWFGLRFSFWRHTKGSGGLRFGYVHWRRSALNSAGEFPENFGEFSPIQHFII